MKNSIRILLFFIGAISAEKAAAAMVHNMFLLPAGGPCYNLTETVAVCRATSYTFPDGYTQVITSQVVHTSNLLTVVTQCDSIIETTVNVLPTYFQEQSFFDICPGVDYTFPDGSVQTILAHTEYESHFQAVGTLCDSTILTVLNTTDISTGTSVSGNVITAQQGNAGYQWVDCDNGFAHINGQNNQSYSAPFGNFAVIIYKGSCTDTSACVQIGTVGITDAATSFDYVYPNPGSGLFTVNLANTLSELNLTIRTLTGQQVQAKTLRNINQFTVELHGAAGIYFMELQSPEGLHTVYRLVKE